MHNVEDPIEAVPVTLDATPALYPANPSELEALDSGHSAHTDSSDEGDSVLAPDTSVIDFAAALQDERSRCNPVRNYLRTANAEWIQLHVDKNRGVIFVLPGCIQSGDGSFTGEASSITRIPCRYERREGGARVSCECLMFRLIANSTSQARDPPDLVQPSSGVEGRQSTGDCCHCRFICAIVRALQDGEDYAWLREKYRDIYE